MTDLQKQAIKEAMQIIHETCWYASEEDINCKDDCPFSKICTALNHSEEVLYSYPCEWNWVLKNNF